mmetsp:Transcript_85626/g.167530  ORF Transcript_85626/g.167530 Transcript_85626/m.167530 type:complete len:225 (+) Transcript_85626:246-920(+)
MQNRPNALEATQSVDLKTWRWAARTSTSLEQQRPQRAPRARTSEAKPPRAPFASYPGVLGYRGEVPIFVVIFNARLTGLALDDGLETFPLGLARAWALLAAVREVAERARGPAGTPDHSVLEQARLAPARVVEQRPTRQRWVPGGHFVGVAAWWRCVLHGGGPAVRTPVAFRHVARRLVGEQNVANICARRTNVGPAGRKVLGLGLIQNQARRLAGVCAPGVPG